MVPSASVADPFNDVVFVGNMIVASAPAFAVGAWFGAVVQNKTLLTFIGVGGSVR
jgi:hypothetical protein